MHCPRCWSFPSYRCQISSLIGLVCFSVFVGESSRYTVGYMLPSASTIDSQIAFTSLSAERSCKCSRDMATIIMDDDDERTKHGYELILKYCFIVKEILRHYQWILADPGWESKCWCPNVAVPDQETTIILINTHDIAVAIIFTLLAFSYNTIPSTAYVVQDPT